jgi:chaperone LolA
MKRRSVLLLFPLLFLAGTAYAAQELDVIKKTYAEISSVEARFQQKIYIMALKRERESKGEFFYKRTRGFLWRYTAPKSKVFLYDGRAVWQEEEDKSFVLKEKVNKDRMQGNFLDLIEDISRLDQFFTVKHVVKQNEGETLDLLPRKEGTIQSARVWVDRNHLVTRIEITEITGNVNTITFSSIRVNKTLSDSLFVFDPGSREVVEK